MPDLITDDAVFRGVVDDLAGVDRYALDTEFHRERTYYPKVALVQIAWRPPEGEQRLVLVDPLEVDLAPLAAVLDGPGTCVLHAGAQDLEVLELVCGTVPSRLFDTQIAAGFLGLSSASLASLLDRELGIRLTKGDRLTDWLRRPLSDDQLRYAAADVDHLLEVADRLVDQLERRDRLDWVEEECELARSRPRTRRTPEEAVARIKEARSLKGRAGRAATAIAAWRERRAAELDVPVRQVLPDIAVVTIAQRAPRSRERMLELRGVETHHLRSGVAEQLLDAMARADELPDAPVPPKRPELARHLRPVVTLVTAWISQLARDHDLDPAILATRSDVESLLAGSEECRLLHGWRADLVGEPIRLLVSGDAAVAFDADGRLVLEARSREPLGPSAAVPTA